MRLTFCCLHIAPYHHAQLDALAKRGVDVTALSFEDFLGAAFDGRSKEKSKKYSNLILSSSSKSWKELFHLLGESRPDVVLVPGWGHAYALAALTWGMQNHVPCVAISDSQECDQSRSFIVEKIKKRLVKLFSAGFVAGQRSKDYIVKLGMPVDRITIGCDVVDNDYFVRYVDKVRKKSEETRHSLGLPRRYFLVVSRLVAIKNIATIIRAYAIYCAEGRSCDWGLVIVGTGQLQKELQQLATELGVDDTVLFIGAVSYADIPAYYALASAFILASYSEPWGLVVNEAMCAGLPVLVSEKCGSSAELVKENVNGTRFNPDDEYVLAMHMGRIASGNMNGSKMGESSREIIKEWSLDRYVKNVRKATEIALSVPRQKTDLIDRLLLAMVIKWFMKRDLIR